jgi:AcrR family transcriptional regulator
MAPTKPSVRRRPQGGLQHRKHVTKRELLAAGRRLFGEQGLYESRVEDLSRHAGVAKGTLYGYFANKTALMESVVSSGFSELLGSVHREAQHARTRPDTVARLVQAHVAFFEENPDLLRIFHQVRGLLKFDVPEGRPLRRVLRNYLAGLAHVLSLKQSSADRREEDNLETAIVLFGAVSGIASTRASLAGGSPRTSRTPSTVSALIALVREFERGAGRRPSSTRTASSSAARAPRSSREPRESSRSASSLIRRAGFGATGGAKSMQRSRSDR